MQSTAPANTAASGWPAPVTPEESTIDPTVTHRSLGYFISTAEVVDMGSWGNEIFESDTASECINKVVTALVEDIRRDLESLEDGVLERPAPACIAMLNALAGIAAVDVSLVASADQAELWRQTLREWLHGVQISEARDSESWKQLGASVDSECSQLVERLRAVES